MISKNSSWRRTISLAVVISLATAASSALAKPTGPKGGVTAVHLHLLHTMLNHGLIMVLQGSNLAMMSAMKMAPGIDEITAAHGKTMIADGKAMVKEALSGSQMKALHEQGKWSDPLMASTHQLGAAVLAVVDDVEKMDMADMGTPEAMRMHHMHIALNHALEMGAEGANLVMLGKMKMAGGIDEISIAHGRKMLADARKLWNEVMAGQTMKDLHAAGKTPETSSQMSRTHRMAANGAKVLDLLEKMDRQDQ